MSSKKKKKKNTPKYICSIKYSKYCFKLQKCESYGIHFPRILIKKHHGYLMFPRKGQNSQEMNGKVTGRKGGEHRTLWLLAVDKILIPEARS